MKNLKFKKGIIAVWVMVFMFSCQEVSEDIQTSEEVEDEHSEVHEHFDKYDLEILARKENYEKNPELLTKVAGIEDQVQKIIEKRKASNSHAIAETINIGLVFTVVYTSTSDESYLSTEDIQYQLDVLNRDYNKQNVNRSNILPEFTSVEGDMDVNFFVRAIRYRQNSKTEWEFLDGEEWKEEYPAWLPTRYINIWTLPAITYDGYGAGGILGYAYIPGEEVVENGIYYGGVTIIAETVNSGSYTGGTLTHEIGHHLGLYHTWGIDPDTGSEDSKCGNTTDFVDDTPKTWGPIYSCDVDKISCGNLAMSMNFMDYGDDACMSMFTIGQVERMEAYLDDGGYLSGLFIDDDEINSAL